MQTLRNARLIARLVLVWFALSLGVAVASPLVAPKAALLVCSGASVKLIVQGADGEIRVDGRPWSDPAVAADVERAAGAGARLVRTRNGDSPQFFERFDILPLLVMTDGAIAEISNASLAAGSVETDRRRFRPNLLLAGVPGLAERGWEGRRLRIGKAGQPDAVVVALADLRGRCVMTTFDPDTLEQEPRVLRTVVERTGGVLGLNAEVVRGGRVRVGDPVELLRG